VLCRLRRPETAERDLIGAWQLPRLRPVRSSVAPTVKEAIPMIVIGVDVHKHSLTAVAVDELGRTLSQWSGPTGAQLLTWARSLAEERLWALEDYRHLSRGLEQLLQAASERLAGAAAADGAAASARPDARQVGRDRRAGSRPRGAAGAASRSGAAASSACAGTCTNSTRR
jgi:hypothetical protein